MVSWLHDRSMCCIQVDKVVYLRHIQAIPNHHGRRAELLLLQGKHAAAEDALVSNRLVWAAIDLNLRLFNWERALAIAEQSDDPLHVQNVLWHRYVLHGAVINFVSRRNPARLHDPHSANEYRAGLATCSC